MKFADNVPFYIRERFRREVRTKPKGLSDNWRSRFEYNLCGATMPLVEDPFVTHNIVAGKSDVSTENKRRAEMGLAGIGTFSVRPQKPIEQLFAAHPDIIRELLASEGNFSSVQVTVPLLDSSGRLLDVPRIISVGVIVGRGDETIFSMSSHPDIVKELEVLKMFSLTAIGNHFVANVVEDFADMRYAIHIDGDPDQTTVLRDHLSRKCAEGSLTIKKVLVVNDNELADLLRSIGFEVVVSDNNAAIDQLKTNKFDLLIADAALPDGIQGFELMRAAKTASSLIKTILFSITTDTRLSHDELIDGYVNRNAGRGELLGMIDLLACD